VYQIDPQKPAARIDPGILSTVIALERMMADFAKSRGLSAADAAVHGKVVIFGSGSLALTLLPDVSTNDLDTIVGEALAQFINGEARECDIAVELLDERLLALLGAWATRTCELIGPLGFSLRLVHPLDTVMQKLLRYDAQIFAQRDAGHIEAVLNRLAPARDTLIDLLTENPTRYARLPGRFSSQTEAVERNTRWFLQTYLPDLTLDEIVRRAGDRAVEATVRAGFLPAVEPVDLRSQLKRGQIPDP
jgi:hypothetical protein